jgi:BirA family biotin operon repressor/biotin-[acetyl-CoA-carboxylase] ligase
VIAGNRFTNAVVGIGLNINQDEFGVDTATSLSKQLGQSYDLNSELEVLLAFIEARYLKLKANEFQSMIDQYLSLLYWRGESHVFNSGSGHFEGTINGLDESGRLKIMTEKGEMSFDRKEISYIR